MKTVLAALILIWVVATAVIAIELFGGGKRDWGDDLQRYLHEEEEPEFFGYPAIKEMKGGGKNEKRR